MQQTFEDLGFDVDTLTDDLNNKNFLAEIEEDEELGFYSVNKVGNRIEIWENLNKETDEEAEEDLWELVKCYPHYNGDSRTEVTFACWKNPGDYPENVGDIVIVTAPPIYDEDDEEVYEGTEAELWVHVPNAHECIDIDPDVWEMQIVAFNHELGFRKSDAPLHLKDIMSYVDEDEEIYPEYLDCGLTWGTDDGDEYPESYMSAKILKISQDSNPATGKKFWVLGVQCENLKMDVVIRHEELPEWVKPGDYVQGLFWFSGKFTNY